MKYNVPQYIDIEDKIAFQLTAKQLGWFALGGVVIFIGWNFLSSGAFYVWATIVALIALAFAFYRPAGLPLASFLKFAVLFLFKPKIYVWKRSFSDKQDVIKKTKRSLEKQAHIRKRETIDAEEIEDILKLLDSQKF